MPRPRQNILSARKIARAALTMTEREQDFTIPGIAKALGVNPSSLYHHVPGGRQEIIALMRRELYSAIDPDLLADRSRPWQERLAAWIREFRDASASVPGSIPLFVRAPVDDDATLQIYEDLFGILRDGGVPADRWPAAAAMLDAIVLGSALDESSPLPLWRPPGTDGYALIRSVTETAERPREGLELALQAAVAAVAALAEDAGDAPGADQLPRSA
ncbi:TetR/AcrR family transcriptional regulator [Nesterenkonia sp. NBAIMH1]|uniref:TetR/AcrR family transcriptional regulator n=1 Tax=Nesterenkonia sp. NBAIMH1 TaxID=2600320 RepID=UPI0011B6A1FC|nr:TetR/AcrR family transcriptional regulator [Nesterenkonia sp. NBAIMH1]